MAYDLILLSDRKEIIDYGTNNDDGLFFLEGNFKHVAISEEVGCHR
jgi:hypothetical protein